LTAQPGEAARVVEDAPAVEVDRDQGAVQEAIATAEAADYERMLRSLNPGMTSKTIPR
jgi:hypothetical protein